MTKLSVLFIDDKRKFERTLQTGERLRIRRREVMGSEPNIAIPSLPAGTALVASGASSVSQASQASHPVVPVLDALHVSDVSHFASNSPRVSQRHAELRVTTEGRVMVKDLDSTNGTWLRLPPFQEYELPPNFELLMGQDLLVQQQTPLWETEPVLGRFASADDFAAHLHAMLKDYVKEIRIVSAYGTEAQRLGTLCTRLPLLERRAYLVVQWQLSTFNLALERWLQTRVLLFNSGSLGEPQPPKDDVPWEFTGSSVGRRHVLFLARRVAHTDGTVLLYGPSGSGKEVLARDLYRHSSRIKGPFVAINCAALPKDLIAGELFGTVKGAFTGATDRAGLFEKAHGGTLFLDEIGELPLDVQATLLRVLDQRKVRRVGETDERAVNVRIIAATNRNLEKMVAEGTFRADLRFRLDAVQLMLPPLQPSDVTMVAPQLCTQLSREGYPELSEEETLQVSRCAARTPWPGNARELRNALQRYLTFRDPENSVEANWHFALTASGAIIDTALEPTVRETIPDADPPEIPDGLMKALVGHVNNLLFLDLARQVLFPWHRGNLTRLGDKSGMTGAGAAARLRKLSIRAEQDGPPPDISQVESQIEAERNALQPHLGYLRSVLGL